MGKAVNESQGGQKGIPPGVQEREIGDKPREQLARRLFNLWRLGTPLKTIQLYQSSAVALL